MEIKKELKKIGIIPKERLKIEEKNYIAKTIANELSNNIKYLSDNYNELYMRIFNCNMYYANIENKLCKIVYFYKNNAIYIDQNKDIFNIDEYIICEAIHYLQQFNKIDKKNKRAGICQFKDFKIVGLGINEAMVQYIACKSIGNEIQKVITDKITIFTNSKEHYKYMTSLVNQIMLLIGEETAIKSCIYSTNDFENKLYDIFEEDTNKILKKFDEIFKENNRKNRNENRIIDTYLQTQEMIYKSYFTKIYNRLTTIKEVDNQVEKLNEYEKIIGKSENLEGKQNHFEIFKDKMSTKFMEKYIEISRKESRNSLTIYKKSFYAMLKRLPKFIQQKIKKNGEN